jgi:predicted nucleic acid-binding Zn ribbon protein
MPIYEYEHLGEPCSLGKIFDTKQSINDESLTQCPNCLAP